MVLRPTTPSNAPRVVAKAHRGTVRWARIEGKAHEDTISDIQEFVVGRGEQFACETLRDMAGQERVTGG